MNEPEVPDDVAALDESTPTGALVGTIERVLSYHAFIHLEDDAIAAAILGDLGERGWALVQSESPPDWAGPLLDALFTGKTLDFDGRAVPEWLQKRLEQEYGFPYPIAQHQPHPDEPGEPVIDPSLLDLGIVHDPTLDGGA